MSILQAGAPGFAHTPVTKSIVLTTTVVTMASWYADSKFVHYAHPVIQEIRHQLGLRSIGHALLCVGLLYNFRVMERRGGSAKFAAFLLFSLAFSSGCRLIGHIVSETKWERGPLPVTMACVPVALSSMAMPRATRLGGITDKAAILLASIQVIYSFRLPSGSFAYVPSLAPALSSFECNNGAVLSTVMLSDGHLSMSRTLEPLDMHMYRAQCQRITQLTA
jgi:hypothetical protein